MEFRTIRQTSHIEGVNRNPDLTEHNKALVWDNDIKKVKYVLINGLNANSKTSDGYVVKGDDSIASNYIWKLDVNKNPAWRKEEFLNTITRSANKAIFTMNSGDAKELALGALAWEDSLTGAVTSVFGRSGDVLALSGDYTASQVTNALDKINDTLDDILEGDTVKYFTASYQSNVNANTLARHSHTNKLILDNITDAGDGVIPTAAQIYEWDNYTPEDAENVSNTVSTLIQDNTGITWIYDDPAGTLTPEIKLDDFTTDNLPEGATNKYFKDAVNKIVFTVTLPSASTVANRILLSTEGTDYPFGWDLSDNGIDLSIKHYMNRRIASVTVFSANNNIERQLFNNAAFSGVYQPFTTTYDEVVIESLATIETPIVIELIFADVLATAPVVPPVIPPSIPSVDTNTPYDITTTSFTTGGYVTDNGGASVTERGILVDTGSNPTYGLAVKHESGYGDGFFPCVVISLNPSTTYYYRAYALNSAGIGYGRIFNFTTHAF